MITRMIGRHVALVGNSLGRRQGFSGLRPASFSVAVSGRLPGILTIVKGGLPTWRLKQLPSN